MAKELKELTPRSVDYSQWYQDLVIKADLAESSAVRGCMVIKPYGYAIWEKMQRQLDDMFKETGHSNAYFPLFIPKSFLSREADHVEGFAKECAVVTHYRLKTSPDGGVVVDPEARLEEELIVRPTSETIIWNTYKGWIQSWRDLPILCNQWANVVRWEMRTRLFLRTAEFLWQEGHTAHATQAEAEEEAMRMVNVYADFARDYMAVPVHMGALIMSHSDDNGLVLPPKLAPYQVVIIPIYKSLEQRDEITRYIQPLLSELKSRGISVRYDDADNKKPGWKFSEYELKGVPVRLALGARDMGQGTIEVARRDTLTKETLPYEGIADHVAQLLEDIQANIYQKALDYREQHTITVDSYEEFKEKIEEGGFILAHWDGTPETEEKIKAETKATIRCIPLLGDKTPGKCMVTGKPSAQRVLFARAY